MTLVLAVPAVDGVVMASDGQVTTGLVRAPGKKIFPLGERAAWAAAGELALIQRVAERLQSLPANRSLVRLRDEIGQVIKQCITELIQLDFRASFFAQDPETLLKLHPADFVFAEFDQVPQILHITVDGVPEWIVEASFAAGSGDLFAYALLRKYQGKNINLERAQVLAYKVMEEAIAVDAYGLGPPIDVWRITEAGARNLSEAEKEVLTEAARKLREAEVNLLLEGDIF
jgi:20S proteasome alpha/beta subunit|uniref:Proteasome subunit alpha n=1 Tax=Desulfobacca acetoxidans TaxID=60893 RepID=A0A7C3WI86_9BACT